MTKALADHLKLSLEKDKDHAATEQRLSEYHESHMKVSGLLTIILESASSDPS
jgi:hypothetical protein